LSARVDPDTGYLAASENGNSIFELFDVEHMPVHNNSYNKVDVVSQLNVVTDLFD
jgi:hypothetical protein